MSAELRGRILDRCCPEPNTGCWLWLGCDAGEGYGVLSVRSKSLKAHRASYLAFVGSIEPGGCVCHRCDTPACVNPEHLFVGTNSDNIRDKVSKGRQQHTRGEQCGLAKLTEEDVVSIRAEYARGGATRLELADRYGVAKRTIGNVVTRTNWGHIP